MTNEIIPATDRTATARGAKALIVGPTGVGKTSLLRTLDLASTLFVDIEAGDICVSDLAVDTFRPRTWPQCRDLACVLAGPNPAAPADAAYSEADYNAAIAELGSPKQYDKGAGADIHELAACVRRATKRDNPAAARDAWHDAEPNWQEMATECRDRGDGRLTQREHEFVNDMVRWTAHRKPSEKQAKWLLAIYCRIGRRR